MDKVELRELVNRAYSDAARLPLEKHPFPIGEAFAQSVGYPVEVLAEIPACCKEAFAGVSNVAVTVDLEGDEQVLDLGCGSGLDTLITARRLNSGGKVIGVDFSEAMLARAGAAAEELSVSNAEFRQGSAEDLPLEDQSVDRVLINGLFNLNPFREDVFLEIARVLRPGGQVFTAELVLKEPLPAEIADSTANWFA